MEPLTPDSPRPKPTPDWVWGVMAAILAGLLLVPLSRIWTVAPDIGHGWAAPILMAYLWWERWAERPRVGPPPSATGLPPRLLIGLIALALVAAPLRLLLTPYPVWPLAVALYGAVLVTIALAITNHYLGRTGVKWVGGPLVLLFGVIPWPGIFERGVILPLRHGIASFVAEASNILGQPAIASGTSIRLAEHWIGIDEACGGIRSLQACVTTALFFGEWLKFSIGRRIVLIVIGVAAALVGNLGRVSILTWSATGPPGRLEQWHDPAGWIALGFSLLTTGLSGWWWSQAKGPNPGSADAAPHPPPGSSTGMVAPKLNWGVGGIFAVLLLVEAGTREWYAQGPKTSVAEDLVPWTVRVPLSAPSFQRQELTDSARDLLQPDAFLSGHWRGANGDLRMLNYVEWNQGQAARNAPFLHNPTVCLPSSGAELEQELGLIQIPWAGGTIPFQTYLFRQGPDVLAVGFTVWDPSIHAPLRSSTRGKGWFNWIQTQWADVRDAKEHQPAQLLAYAISGRENQDRLAIEIEALLAPSAR